MTRESQIKSVQGGLRGQRLIWYGTRGTDAAPLLELEGFSGVISLIAPLGVLTRPGFSEESLELISGERVDLDLYSTDDDRSESIKSLHRALLDLLRDRATLVTYRPSNFLSAAYFPRMHSARYMGMFAAHALAYDHKPWVESGLRAAGVPTVPWEYYHDEDIGVLIEAMHGRAFVLRSNYSDGGAGLRLVPAGADPGDHVPCHSDGFIAAAPYLEPSVPLNVSGCVFPSGDVSVRAPSLQLIGIRGCTSREFGYCGNDFAGVSGVLTPPLLDDLESAARRIGAWLHGTGYVGSFGVDALLSGRQILVTEVNPRFQGCSAAAAALALRLNTGDVYLDHLSAFLLLPVPADGLPLRDQARLQAERGVGLSQVVCSNATASVCVAKKAVVPDLDFGVVTGVARAGLRVAPEGMLFRMTVDGSVTADGTRIPAKLARAIDGLRDGLYSAEC